MAAQTVSMFKGSGREASALRQSEPLHALQAVRSGDFSVVDCLSILPSRIFDGPLVTGFSTPARASESWPIPTAASRRP